MPLAPEIEFHHDPTWVAGEPKVFMTPMKVWGPLISGLLYVMRMAFYV